jgi:elongation factor Ts
MKDIIIKLRKQTGAGIIDIKEALEESGGDEEKALDVLRKKGKKIASKRAGREAGEGWIGSYVHANGKAAAMVKLQCETDFVARNVEFQELAHDIAMQVVAANPEYLKPEDVPTEVIEKEKEIYTEEVKKQGKPDDMIEKITQGKLEKYYQEVCLLKQAYIKDDLKNIEQLLEEATAKIGEKIEVTEFERLEI